MKRCVLLWCVLLLLLLAGCGKTDGTQAGLAESPLSDAEGPASSQPEVPEETDADAAKGHEPVDLAALLADIYAAVPGAEEREKKITHAAEELLEGGWIGQEQMEELSASVSQWVQETVPPEELVPLALAYDAVLTQAEALLPREPGSRAQDAFVSLMDDDQAYLNDVCAGLSPLFTGLLELAEPKPYREGPRDFSSVDASRLHGIWVNGVEQTILIFENGRCRVVYPALSHWGAVAGAYRVRDRSELGYCPALEIDFHGEGPMNEDGDFHGPLAYYVSGMDDSHFWCNSQQERFDRILAE